MMVKSIWLRRIHKWVGLAIGLQFLLWAISGTAMALLNMDDVAGGERAEHHAPALRAGSAAWPRIQRALAGQPITKVSLHPLPWGQALQVTSSGGVVQLFSPADGAPLRIGAREAALIAASAHPHRAAVTRVTPLRAVTLAVRDHELPI